MRLLSIALISFLACQVHAGITFKAGDSNVVGATTATLTISITNNATSDVLGLLRLGVHDSTDADRVISSVKWGGTNMIQACGTDNLGNNKSGRVYYLVAPPTGSNRIVVAFAGTVSGTAGMVNLLEGVDQTSPVDAVNVSTNVTSTTPSLTVTSLVSNAMLVDQYTKYLTTGTCSPGSAQAHDANATVGASYWHASTHQLATTNGIYRFSYTNSLTSGSIIAIMSIKPSVATAVTTNRFQPSLMTTGVGP